MKFLYTLLIFCFLHTLVLAQPPSSNPWADGRFFPVKKNQHWGIIQHSGELLVAPKYQAIEFGLSYADSLYPYFLVKVAENKWGVLDTLGQEVLAPQYCDIEIVQPKGPYFSTRTNCGDPVKLEVARKLKRSISIASLQVTGEELEGFKAVADADSLLYKMSRRGLVGLQNLRRGSVLPTEFTNIEVFPKKAYILTQRRVNGEELYGLYSMNGKELLPSRYEDVRELPSDFLALQDTADHLWYIHHADGFSLQRGYEEPMPYSEGFKLLHGNPRMDKSSKGYDFFIPEERIIRRNLYYEAFSLFGPYMGYMKDGKFGVVDDVGMEMLPPVFTHLRHIGKGFIEVSMQMFGRTERGVITVMGEKIVPPKYEKIKLFEGKVLLATSKKGFMLYDQQGVCVTRDGPCTNLFEMADGDYHKVVKRGKKGYGLLYLYEDEVILDWYSNVRALAIGPMNGTPTMAAPSLAPSTTRKVVAALRTDTIGKLSFSSRLLDEKGPLYAPWEVQLAASQAPLDLGEIREVQFPVTDGAFIRYSLSFFDEESNSFKKRQYLLNAAKAQVITPPIFSGIEVYDVEGRDFPFFIAKLANKEGKALIDSTGRLLTAGISTIKRKEGFIEARRIAQDYKVFLDNQASVVADSVERREAVDWAGLFELQQVDKPFFNLVDSSFNVVRDSLTFIDQREGFRLAKFAGQSYHSLLDGQLQVLVDKVNTIHQEDGLTFLQIEEQDYRMLIDSAGKILADSITEAWRQGNCYLARHIGRTGLSLMRPDGTCFLSGIVSYEEGEDNYLTVAFKKGADVRYGLVDTMGNWVIEPHYRDLSGVKDGWMIASVEGTETGIIDLQSNWIVKPTQDYILPFNKATGVDGFMLRREPEQQDWRILQQNGSYLLSESFERLSPVYENYLLAKKAGKWGMLWTDGTTRLPFDYEGILPFRAGFAPAKKAGAWGLLDQKGAVVVNFGYMDFGTHFGDYFPIKKDKGWGLMKADGGLILACAFDSIRYHKNALVQAATNGHWRLFDAEGNLLLRKTFQAISEFNAIGMAQTQSRKGLGLINEKGEKLLAPRYAEISYLDTSGFILARKKKHWGLWDPTGNRLLNKRYTKIIPFNTWGVAKAYTTSGNIHLLHKEAANSPVRLRRISKFDGSGKAIAQRKTLWSKATWGLIDAKGNWCVEPIYEQLELFEERWIRAERKGKSGLFSREGEPIIAVEYDEIKRNQRSATYRVRKGSYWGLLSAEGKWIGAPQYHKVSDFIYTDSIACVEMANNLFGLTQEGALLKWSNKWRKLPKERLQTEPLEQQVVAREMIEKDPAAKQGALFPFGKTTLMQPFLIGEDTMQFNLMRLATPKLQIRSFIDSSSFVNSPALYQFFKRGNWGLQARSSAKYRDMALLGAGLTAARRPYERDVIFKNGTQIPNGPFDFVDYMGAGIFRLEQGQQLGYWHREKGWIWPLQE